MDERYVQEVLRRYLVDSTADRKRQTDKYREIGRERDRQTQREIERDRESQRHTQRGEGSENTGRERDRQTDNWGIRKTWSLTRLYLFQIP